MLNKQGIAASSGSACTSGSLEPSHVMRAMGIPYTAAHGTIRFSLSRYNSEEEIDRVRITSYNVCYTKLLRVVSGALGASRNQQLHYALLIVCFIVPLMAVAGKLGYFWAIPQLGRNTFV